jgi:long-chain acyl-CoA synthetase
MRLSKSLRLGFGAGLPLGELTQVLAERFGDRPAVNGRTYAHLEHDVARLAAAYAELSVEGVAGVVCENTPDLLVHVLALARAGAVALPINHRLKPAEQRAILDAGRATPAPIEAAQAWLREHPRGRLPPSGAEKEPALLLATSGTTGQPKLAPISSRALLGAIGRVHALPVGNQRFFRPGRDVVLMALPLSHVMGLATMLGALCAGVRVIHHERFEAAKILDAMEHERPNVFVGVPTMYADLEAEGAAQRDLSSLELFISAADAMPPDRARRFQKYGAFGPLTAGFADVYGMVELAGPAAVRIYPPSPRFAGLPSVGFVLPGFEARTVDGELQLRGGNVPEWFPTGDVARLGPGGTFVFVGRSLDRLKVGGFSVFPAEVEEELRGHPGVAEVAVVGAPDERLGEVPVAIVVAPNGLDAEEFLRWSADRVAPYRRPRAVVLARALPRGPNGKLDRRAARRLLDSAAHVPADGVPER